MVFQIKLEEVVTNKKYIALVNITLQEFIHRQKTRPQPKQGFRYKRNWYDRLKDKNNDNASFFLDNILDIWNKRSKLNSETRGVILSVCNIALNEYLKEETSKSSELKK
jgi:hypothetical protein